MKGVIETQDQRQIVLSKKMLEFHEKDVSLSEALEKAKKWYYGDAWISDSNELAKKRTGMRAYVRLAPFEEWEIKLQPKKRNWFLRLFGVK